MVMVKEVKVGKRGEQVVRKKRNDAREQSEAVTCVSCSMAHISALDPMFSNTYMAWMPLFAHFCSGSSTTVQKIWWRTDLFES